MAMKGTRRAEIYHPAAKIPSVTPQISQATQKSSRRTAANCPALGKYHMNIMLCTGGKTNFNNSYEVHN